MLQWLEAAGIRLKREKCVFLADDVTYLGHRIKHKYGRDPTEDKVQLIKNLLEPNTSTNFRLFMECFTAMVATYQIGQPY